MSTASGSSAIETKTPSWVDLMAQSAATQAGKALNHEMHLRSQGRGSASRENTLRKFDKYAEPAVTLYRDHAAWCPYCQKTMLLVEEKQIPVRIELINMRSYGDKSREYLQKVPGGLLPAIEVRGQVITESQVIMELLDQWFPQSQGYRSMMPSSGENKAKYQRLAALERDLFGHWCSVVFRPERGIAGFLGGGSEGMSAAMNGFMDCIKEVDRYLLSTKGPWFLDEQTDYPTMIDFIYVSHVERMLASLAYWKGVDLRDVKKWNLRGLAAWLEAFEKREPYLAFKSDYYTHVMDIPPQYGPGYEGGFSKDRSRFQQSILGTDGKSWHLPLSHDDPLQPLYKGPPLPLCVLQAHGIEPDNVGTYESVDPQLMATACRSMAAWKLANNGAKVAQFAARGGPQGSKNPRKTFSAPLADPYAAPDEKIQPLVDAALRVICAALMDTNSNENNQVNGLPNSSYAALLRETVGDSRDGRLGVVSSLEYLRDRVGVPRDLPLAAARYLRAYLNWGIDALS
ncbi:hypothetical protein ACA910_021373 [Epithemia clementina (nom. ined.)]